jgi:hypothetical protein
MVNACNDVLVPKTPAKPKPPKGDVNALAAFIVAKATDSEHDDDMETIVESEAHVAAVALGRLGGLKGGEARARRLTSEQRSEIAKRAAMARWRTKK